MATNLSELGVRISMKQTSRMDIRECWCIGEEHIGEVGTEELGKKMCVRFRKEVIGKYTGPALSSLRAQCDIEHVHRLLHSNEVMGKRQISHVQSFAACQDSFRKLCSHEKLLSLSRLPCCI